MSVGTDTDRSEASELIRGMVRSGLAGFGAGFIVGGVGGRLAMRAASLIDQSAHGSRTEAGFRIGEFTLGGTLELVIFIGLFGGLAVSAIWTVTERWLPGSTRAKVMSSAVVAVAFGGPPGDRWRQYRLSDSRSGLAHGGSLRATRRIDGADSSVAGAEDRRETRSR